MIRNKSGELPCHRGTCCWCGTEFSCCLTVSRSTNLELRLICLQDKSSVRATTSTRAPASQFTTSFRRHHPLLQHTDNASSKHCLACYNSQVSDMTASIVIVSRVTRGAWLTTSRRETIAASTVAAASIPGATMVLVSLARTTML